MLSEILVVTEPTMNGLENSSQHIDGTILISTNNGVYTVKKTPEFP